MRIYTGAPVPEGADTVVMREHLDETPSGVCLNTEAPEKGAHIRRKGENAPSWPGRYSQRVAWWAWLRSGFWRALACPAPEVVRGIKVAVVATGDEVLAPDDQPQPWQLRDSNSSTLQTLLGWVAVDRRAAHDACGRHRGCAGGDIA